MTTRLERIVSFVPEFYKPSSNVMFSGILKALAQEDTDIDTSITDAKDQLYISRAVSKYLDFLASNFNVARPTLIKFIDSKFRELIPVLTYWPKQVKPTIYKCLELFWNIEYLHSTATSGNFETFNLVGGETLSFLVDETHEVSVTFLADDFAVPGAATAQEVVDRINEWLPDYLIAHVYVNKLLNQNFVMISTSTFGLAGSVQVTGGTANVALAFDTNKHQYTKVSIHEIYPNELVVRMPKKIIIELDSLLWSHRFHVDSTIIDSRPVIDTLHPYWPGSFFYDRASGTSLEIHNITTTLGQIIAAGGHYALVTLGDTSQFVSTGGYVVFRFGLSRQEHVRYLSRPTNTTLLLDATYAFSYNHAIGETVNYCLPTPYAPRITGIDYPIFFVDTEVALQLVGSFVLLLKAAGIIVRWILEDD
jgi:hypothetical protein